MLIILNISTLNPMAWSILVSASSIHPEGNSRQVPISVRVLDVSDTPVVLVHGQLRPSKGR